MYWYKQMDKGDMGIAVFIDLKKAFDTVDHNILLNKLMRYGIKDND
jgi:RNA-binding protein YlmH